MELAGKSVLVTGADGFIGSHLVEQLLEENCRVNAFVFYNSFGTQGWLDTLSDDQLSRIRVISGDIRDAHRVQVALEEIDVVFHLAALIAIPYSYQAPDSYVATNIRGTLNVLQAAQLLGTHRVVITSTSEVYGTAQYVPIDEQHSQVGQSPYAATKIGGDRMAEAFYRSYGTPVTIVRPFNTYGPRQSARAVIPTIITQLLSGAGQIKLGRLSPTRDWMFVRDTVQGFVAAARCDTLVGEEVNLATQQETSVGQVARLLIEQINPSAVVAEDQPRLRPADSEVQRLLGSSEKMRRHTEWQPQYDLASGLAETVQWFRAHKNRGYDAETYQI